MIQFVLLNLLMISLAAILFVFVRTLPRIETREAVKQGIFERWITSRFPERMDQFFSGLFMRTLRKAKVLVLKADNILNQKLERLKLERGDGIRSAEKPDLQSLAKEEREAEEVSAAD